MREDEADGEDLVSRSDKKRARRVREDALSRLTKELVEVSDGTLSRLGLDEGLVDAVRDARLIKSARAKDRQLRVVRGLLRSGEWGAIASRLDTLLLHGKAPPKGLEPSPEEGQARQWAVRLMGEGALALDELLSAHPAADRRHLRDLIRNATHGSPASRKRAEAKLAEVIRLLLR
ncbi:MAG: DUF615 domain-containing protein [Polyangiaceae bacterium]|nr:DUF615 domain-containing protein [Polyangiaceae bacterium]